jgi:hypothetical protein
VIESSNLDGSDRKHVIEGKVLHLFLLKFITN